MPTEKESLNAQLHTLFTCAFMKFDLFQIANVAFCDTLFIAHILSSRMTTRISFIILLNNVLKMINIMKFTEQIKT